jgi:tRNA (guanine37-N1)-methyltransferase
MQIDVFTLFPEWFDWMRRPRHLANASGSDQLELRCFNFRDYTPLPAGQVDDAPYGGGAGMVLRVDVVAAALEAVYGTAAEDVKRDRRVVVLTPRGRTFSDAIVREYAEYERITLLSGRYEGFDGRVHQHLASDELSLGGFVLAGGETAAMAVIDAVGRRLPGALGNVESLEHESFSPALDGRVEHLQFSRPAEFRSWAVPRVLLSGDHAAVARWRDEQSHPPPDAADAPRSE